jgi:DNA primase
MIAPATIEAVKALNLVDVVRHYVPELKKSGSNWSAKSPFTDEKTASFYVVPTRNFYKCFSSGKAGGVINFVIDKFGSTYVDAIKMLCSDFRVKLEYDENDLPPAEKDEIEALYKLNMATARVYAKELAKLDAEHPAKKELLKRQFSQETIDQWQIGFAPGNVTDGYTPAQWKFLTKTVIDHGQYKFAQEVGLVRTKGEVTYDTFRNRIMFPIIDHQDRVVGFGGRALMEDEFNQKYINTSGGTDELKNRIYNKSNVLFGLNHAAEHIKAAKFAILLEGYTDVISFHQAAMMNSVASCGTALTDAQCQLLKRFTNKVVVMRDGDAAGQKATLRDIDILLKHGFEVFTVPVPSIITLKPKPAKKVKGKKPTAKSKTPKAIIDIGFITARGEESLTYSMINDKGERLEIERSMDEVETIGKVDPDELVRMFNPAA